MKEIKMRNGAVALVDDDNYERFRSYAWNNGIRGGYAARSERGPDGKNRTVFMHLEILTPPKGMKIDHADGNPLNNQRANLRVCTQRQNTYNRRIRKDAKGKYKGVTALVTGIWRAEVNRVYYGNYRTEELAAEAYDRAALKLYGEFARLNFPKKDYSAPPEPKRLCVKKGHRWRGELCMRCVTEKRN